ncbi:PREDICTED: uncharacterized protein LOC104595868 [Nelumbo nucifera]|uniref:Uncharacterized protein LOC104595868 n=1 Tax=Nelumbo nucifera TaxID=4432 RepID=A0A1U8A0L7_NELNU|nr:PREDICTED: uncharacterized protein LOC104595868 [Nelumbo nucifera]
MADREKEKLHQFLMGLNDNYNTLRTNFLGFEPLPSLNKTYSLILQEERHQTLMSLRGPVNPEAVALNASSQTNNRGNSGASSNTTLGRSKYRCDYYKRQGHTKDRCYELNGYPAGWEKGHSNRRSEKKTSQPAKQDSDHRTNAPVTCAAASESSSTVTGSPLVGLSMQQYQQLLSLLNQDSSEAVAAPTSVSITGDSYDLWHRRLGHTPGQRLSLITGLPSAKRDHCCDACHRAKQVRLPFPISTSCSSTPFELLHCDIWGGYKTPLSFWSTFLSYHCR